MGESNILLEKMGNGATLKNITSGEHKCIHQIEIKNFKFSTYSVGTLFWDRYCHNASRSTELKVSSCHFLVCIVSYFNTLCISMTR